MLIQKIYTLEKIGLDYDKQKNVEVVESSKPPTKKVECSKRNEEKAKIYVDILRISHQGGQRIQRKDSSSRFIER